MATDFGHTWHSAAIDKAPRYCRIHFDGSWQDPCCGSGWVCYGSEEPGLADDCWQPLAWMSFPVHGSSVTAAELEALAAAQAYIHVLLTCPRSSEKFMQSYMPWRY